MTPLKFSRPKSICSLLLPAIVTVALSVAPIASGQEGKGASADDWFVKSAKDRKEKTQMAIAGGEKPSPPRAGRRARRRPSGRSRPRPIT